MRRSLCRRLTASRTYGAKIGILREMTFIPCKSTANPCTEVNEECSQVGLSGHLDFAGFCISAVVFLLLVLVIRRAGEYFAIRL